MTLGRTDTPSCDRLRQARALLLSGAGGCLTARGSSCACALWGTLCGAGQWQGRQGRRSASRSFRPLPVLKAASVPASLPPFLHAAIRWRQGGLCSRLPKDPVASSPRPALRFPHFQRAPRRPALYSVVTCLAGPNPPLTSPRGSDGAGGLSGTAQASEGPGQGLPTVTMSSCPAVDFL